MSSWSLVLMSSKGNISPAMLDVCAVMAPAAEVLQVDIDDADACEALLDRTGRRFTYVAISHLLGVGEEALLSQLRWDQLILSENGIATHVLPDGRARRLGADGRPGHRPDAAILPLAGLAALGLPAYLNSESPPRLIAVDARAYRRLHARLQAAFDLAD
ncbi:MAG: hypothetical protein JJU18_13405 [Oceanicaulis sp.]|nr:hypothetical protein [Oceanicaulis sp.]